MAELDSDTQLTLPHRPRSLIIVPTRELAQQVTIDALKPFHYKVPLRFGAAHPGKNRRIESDMLANGVDCLVTTPDRMQYRRDGDKLFISQV